MVINSTRTILFLLNGLNSNFVLGLNTDAALIEKTLDDIMTPSITSEENVSLNVNEEIP